MSEYLELIDEGFASLFMADRLETRTASAKEPYGPASEAKYADPGKQGDKKKRYPLDTEAHCRAAWSYINMPKNAAKYTSEQLAAIKSKIKAAAKRLGIQISSETRSGGVLTMEDLPTVEDIDSRVEMRSTARVDDVDYPERIITVCAVPYEEPTQVMYKRAVWNEVFSRSAFKGLDASKRRIPATACLKYPMPSHSHEGAELVGRIQEVYTDRDEGLIADVKIGKTPLGDSTLNLAADRSLSVSVGFIIRTPHYDESLDVHSRTRRINRAFLEHLAFVGEPAYSGAQVLAMRAPADLATDQSALSGTPSMDKWLEDPIIAAVFNKSHDD